jgi:hypothetical protein
MEVRCRVGCKPPLAVTNEVPFVVLILHPVPFY